MKNKVGDPTGYVRNLFEVGSGIRTQAEDILVAKAEAEFRLAEARRIYRASCAGLLAARQRLDGSVQQYWGVEEIAAARAGKTQIRASGGGAVLGEFDGPWQPEGEVGA